MTIKMLLRMLCVFAYLTASRRRARGPIGQSVSLFPRIGE